MQASTVTTVEVFCFRRLYFDCHVSILTYLNTYFMPEFRSITACFEDHILANAESYALELKKFGKNAINLLK